MFYRYSVNPSVLQSFKFLGISRYRGSRGGCRRRIPVRISNRQGLSQDLITVGQFVPLAKILGDIFLFLGGQNLYTLLLMQRGLSSQISDKNSGTSPPFHSATTCDLMIFSVSFGLSLEQIPQNQLGHLMFITQRYSLHHAI